MSAQVRFFMILIVIALSVALIWPNIGERTIRLYPNETLSETKRDEVLNNVFKYVNEHYKGKYTPEIRTGKPIDNPKGVQEKYLSITGKFVQAAFLNELGRIEGVDASRMALEPMWVERNLKAKPFKLGLDLQGGMNLVLEGDFEKVATRIKEVYPPEMIAELEKKKETEKNPEEKKSIEAKLASIKQAMDLSPEKRKSDMEGVLQILSSRINQTGTSEPLIRLQGNEQIEISLPGVANPDQAKQLIASTARVTYHLHDPNGEEQRYTQLANAEFSEYMKLETDVQRLKFLKTIETKINLPKKFALMVMYGKNPNMTKSGQHLEPESFLVVDKEPVMTGDAMSRNVYEDRNPEDGRIVVSFELTSEGADKFGKITTENQGKLLAIAIDDKIRSAPRIQGPILGGRGQITGDFDVQEARSLAIVIREGALPVPLNIVEERSVGPTLGQAAIDSGLKAISIGFILVFAYMLLYYHGSGFIASVGLLINLLLMAAIFALMDFTITLPGLAGVVLTMGMAVDSNVIIYERIREELARGKSVKLAVAAGFERATLTIIDANLTTLIAAVILASKLGVGPIKGFGVTLFIGIVTTLFTALIVTRAVMEWLAYSVEIKSLSIGFGQHRNAAKLTGGKV